MELDEKIFERLSANIHITFGVDDRFADILERLIPKPKTGEIKIMANFVVKDDNPDVGVKVTVVGGDVDSEGHPTGGLKIAISSTDDAVVQVTDNGDGSGNVHFGAPGQASTQYSVSDASGNVLGTGSDGFTVTTGDPTAISSITAAFDGLTPVMKRPQSPKSPNNLLACK